ncbi:MAG: pyridoxine 5'-phosphate synthase [Planctomycetes bacterium]|nr:pyridoxine 5'-phosphate synthase [Planctomycetota bacterium]
MIRLGVNVDHVATIRQARGGREPDPVTAAHEAELGGADQITVHLREDRRHIQDRDLRLLRQTVQTPLNLELAVSADVIAIALDVRPDQVTLVPERREEVTTEGGLDVVGGLAAVRAATARFAAAGVAVSLFIDPEPAQVEAARESGATHVELHTGQFALARGAGDVAHEVERLRRAGARAHELGLHLALGHGLDYRNVVLVRDLPHVAEMNIGHSIVSRAVYVGLREAVREMKRLLV